KGCDRVHDENVDGAGPHQRVGDFQRLFAGVGLRDQQVVDIDAELAGIDGIERVFGIDEGADAAIALRFGYDVQGQRRLARAFRPEDLDDTAARQAADAKSDIEAQRTGGDRFNLDGGILAKAHDRALAEVPLDLAE